MKIKFIPLILLLFIGCNIETKKNSNESYLNKPKYFEELNAQSMSALNNKDYKLYSDLCYKILELSPTHPNLQYNYARSLALLNKNDEAISWLENMINNGGTRILSIESDSIFNKIFKDEGFKKLLKKAKTEIHPVNNSEIAYKIEERDLIPEGIAYDPEQNKIYVSSIYKRKILSIDKNGVIQNFIKEKQDGVLGVIGMEIDPVRRNLWVCSAWDGTSKILDIDNEKDKRTSIYKFNVDTGELVKKYTLADTTARFFNDLTIHPDGDVYFTDWFAGEIYTIPSQRDELELFSSPAEYLYPNGITLSEDGRFLFVGHLGGTERINLDTKDTLTLKHPDNVTLVNIDGLAYYNNSLIAHQGSTLGGVFRYTLNSSMDSVIQKSPLEVLNHKFDFPSTGEIAGDIYYYIANAQFGRFNKDGTIFTNDKLDDVYILKIKLDN